MKVLRALLFSLACLATPALGMRPVEAAPPPWKRIELFKRIEADPNKSYQVTENNGPWMIMAVTFSGDNAEEQARELTHEIRSRYKLPAYTHQVSFDYSQDTAGGKNQLGGARRAHYRMEHIREIAVLVGDYTAVDDREAQKVLEKLKYAQPDCLNVELRAQQGRRESRSLALWRVVERSLGSNEEKQKKGPMGHAFITTNPLLPNEYFAPKGIDKLVLEMNEPVKYSLLDCPGKYTVKVATFTGTVVLKQEIIRELEEHKGKKIPSQLAAAAEKAHNLTEALRRKGYEAYEFHDRYASIVTVGNFASVGTPRQDGKIEINPQIHAIMQTFGADKTFVPGQATPTIGKPKVIADIALDTQPIPVEVPKRSISVAYERPGVGRR
jgi:signal recognition particle subunit SEC65